MADVKLTLEQTIAGLKELADERPDFVYKNELGVTGGACFYAHGSEPGCIVGHLAYRNGIPFDDLASGYATAQDIWADNRAGEFAKLVQIRQDAGLPWGKAFQFAVDQWAKTDKEIVNV